MRRGGLCMGCIHPASIWTKMRYRSAPQPWPGWPWIMCRGKVELTRACAGGESGHRSVDMALTGAAVGFAEPRVAGDDDDTPDQSCWRGNLRLTQLKAPADALDQSQPLGGAHEALAAQHAEVPQTCDERVGVNAILHGKVKCPEGFMQMRRRLGASGAAPGTQTMQVWWKEDRWVYLTMNRAYHRRV